MANRSMRMMMALPLLAAGLASGDASAAPSACDAVAGNLVTNCGFETTGGWSATTPPAAPHTGIQSVLIGYFSGPVALEQTVVTLAGQTYDLAFFAKNQTAFTVDVFFDGTKILSAAPGIFGFTEYTASVTASSTASVLRFERSGSSGYGYIDDVTLVAQAVPEPASLALLGAGVAGLAGLRRRRKA